MSPTDRVLHLVVGPDRHGVVQHGVQVARACGHRLLRAPDADAATQVLADAAVPVGAVVHVPFTDRLFGPTIEAATDAVLALAGQVAGYGAALSVTLHDVPHDDSPLQLRRLDGYARVMAVARGVVVNSRVELGLVEDLAATVHSLRVVPLPVQPVEAPAGAAPDAAPRVVAVLGFVYPDRGYEDVLAALPPGAELVALGRPADGHDDLPARYAELARGRWRCTGYVPDGELADRLAAAAVPVAPNRRVTASASVSTWIAHGRRPLVPDSPYARELAADRPGTVRLYDPDDPSSLAGELAAALADPARTRLPAGVDRGPSLAHTAAAYREHLDACRPACATRTARGTLVPGNRWDLVPQDAAGRVSISVVIPYYDAQPQLDLVLSALAAQTRTPDEVIVVDDGSPVLPDLRCAGSLPVTAVRQEDEGFRAARARNLGARHATGDVLVFLDGDTAPEPGFLAALTRLPARCPDAVTVGRRRHADLSALGAQRLPAVLAGDGPDPLPEPAWLADAYRGSGDLLHTDRRSYRYLISALLAVPAALFAEVGGFDERFVGYGGEDWELAHRLRNAGAVLAHVPDAVAWHDGPEWAQRGDAAGRARAKNAETAALAGLLPDPDHRGAGRWLPYPSIVVQAGDLTDVEALATVRSAAGVDCGFWFAAITGPARAVVLADPGVHLGTPPADVLARAWCRARLTAPADLAALPALAELADRHGRVDTPALQLRAAYAASRAARWCRDVDIDHTADTTTDPDALADRLFGRHDRTAPVPVAVDDLLAWLQGRR